MVLSRLELNLEDPSARRDLANPYEMHSTLMRVVEESASRPLWRIEQQLDVSMTASILIQSEGVPDSEALRAYAPKYFRKFDSKQNVLLENLANGQVLNFRLRANPTVTREGKRHGLDDVDEQLAWIERQVTRAGGELLGAETSNPAKLKMVRRSQSSPIVILGVTFDGQLRVLDDLLLKVAVRTGIGPGKALGFGLLTLSR